ANREPLAQFHRRGVMAETEAEDFHLAQSAGGALRKSMPESVSSNALNAPTENHAPRRRLSRQPWHKANMTPYRSRPPRAKASSASSCIHGSGAPAMRTGVSLSASSARNWKRKTSGEVNAPSSDSRYAGPMSR